jgi:lipopolysaccharide/colanic/teichoic acid biosynthesis glycosyltransferase
MAYSVIKRALDLLAALCGLIVLAPVAVGVAAAVRHSMGGPVLFRQQRLGFGDREFSILKFRTMSDARDADGRLLPDSQRLTRIGAFLRKTSLDELPQLWNVLVGDMSFVGPRPLYPHYLPFYTARERMRHHVRPGITGLAQVSGRNELAWDVRLELDVQYVERQSISLDLAIAVRTVAKVLSGSDVIVVPGSAQGPLNRCRAPSAPIEGSA